MFYNISAKNIQVSKLRKDDPKASKGNILFTIKFM